jgi:hypothetical protein
VNGNLRVHGVTENVEIDLPNAPASRSSGRNSFQPEDRGYSFRLGAGGADIVISGIEGSVKIHGFYHSSLSGEAGASDLFAQ